MKNLRESILDDDDKLFNDTDAYKDFPDFNDTIFDSHKNIYYYKWESEYLASNYLKYIKPNYKVLYIKYYKPKNSGYKNPSYVIRILLSDKHTRNIDSATPLYGFLEYSKTKKEAQVKAYNILSNIKKNPDILKIIDDYNSHAIMNPYHYKEYKLNDLKALFKKEWID